MNYSDEADAKATAERLAEIDAALSTALGPSVEDHIDGPRPGAKLKCKLYATGGIGNPLPTMENLLQIFLFEPQWRGVFAYDELACCVLQLRPPPLGVFGPGKAGLWEESALPALQAALNADYKVEFSRNDIRAAVEHAARRKSYHPVRDALQKLRWDGVGRLSTWLQDYFGAKDCPYTRTIGPKILIAAVARVFRPGCKLDTMPILEGGQGLAKSTAWKILAGGAEWFSDTPLSIGDKDSFQALQGKWIIEFAELAALLKKGGSRLELAKAYLSAPADHYRPSYERQARSFPRQCIFVGTTNEDDYLCDPTGNRRFWPIACGAFDLDGLAIQRDQLFAEAAVRFAFGEAWHLSAEEQATAAVEQSARNEEDPWEGQILTALRGREYVTISALLEEVLDIPSGRRGQADSARVQAVLRRHGWKSRNGSARPRRWFPVTAPQKESVK